MNNLMLAFGKCEIYRRKSIPFNFIIIIFWQFWFQSELEVKGCFYLKFISMSKGMGKGSNKVLDKEALAQVQNIIFFT